MDKLITNPNSVGVTVTDFRTGIDASGALLDYYNEQLTDCVANGAVAVGDLCVRVVPTATQGLRFNKGGAAPAGWTVAGVAVTPATAAGRIFSVVKYGFCRVNVGSGTPAIGDMGVIGATAGQVDVVAAATGATATTVAGTILGHFLGTKDGSNLAAFWYQRT